MTVALFSASALLAILPQSYFLVHDLVCLAFLSAAIILLFLSRRTKRRAVRLADFAFSLGFFVLAAWMVLFPPVARVREAAAKLESGYNLSQINLAIEAYVQENGFFPRQAIYDKQGKPLLSWRVAILPYLEQKPLYEQFHLDEPWDSSHNLKLLERMPEQYLHPVGPRKLKEGYTHYLAFAGKVGPKSARKAGGAFTVIVANPQEQTTWLDILNWGDPASVFMLAEAATPVPWTKPEDLPDAPEVGQLSSMLQGGFWVLCANGDRHFFKHQDLSEDKLRQSIQVRAGAP